MAAASPRANICRKSAAFAGRGLDGGRRVGSRLLGEQVQVLGADELGQVTALQAATVALEMLALTAIARRGDAGGRFPPQREDTR